MGEFWTTLRVTLPHRPRPVLHMRGWHPVALLVALLLVSGAAFGQFQPYPVSGLPGLIESSVAWGDYDNDGYLDLFVAGTTDTMGGAAFDNAKDFTKIYHNNGNGTFTDIGASLDRVYVATSAWGDYDNDGYLDLAYGGADTANAQVTKLYHNNRNGTFTEVSNPFHSSSYGALAWGDFNNDGLLDLVIVAYDNVGPTTKLYRNNGGGNFTEVTNPGLQGVNGHGKVAWADFNNDGYQDIVLCGRTNGISETDPRPVTKVYFNHHGDGTFTEDTTAHIVGIWKGGIAVGDLNNDGRVDLLVGGMTTGSTGGDRDTSLAYLNNGNGTFTAVMPGIPGVAHSFVTLGDYDADGRLDAIVKGYGSNSGVFHGNGNGTFSQIALAQSEMAFGSVAMGDFNNDGYLDYIATGVHPLNNRDTTVLFINNGPGTSSATPFAANARPAAPTGLQAVVADSVVTLSWHRASDARTPAVGLTYNVRIGTTVNGGTILSPLSDSTGFRRVARMGNVFEDSSFTIRGLANGTYYWSVQSVDNGYAGSLFAAVDTFTVGPVTPPPVKGLRLNARVILQGPYQVTGDSMSTALRTSGTLASHFGAVRVPRLAVDSVSIEIRDSSRVAASHTRRVLPAWLLKDGSIQNFTDSTRNYVQFDSLTTGSFYVVVRHRNHLAIMSASRVALNDTTTTTYDFTTGQAKAWGSNSMVAVGTKFAMAAGDGDGSGGVNASDLNGVWRPQNGQLGYLRGDFDLSGGVNATDRNGFWKVNNGRLSQVP